MKLAERLKKRVEAALEGVERVVPRGVLPPMFGLHKKEKVGPVPKGGDEGVGTVNGGGKTKDRAEKKKEKAEKREKKAEKRKKRAEKKKDKAEKEGGPPPKIGGAGAAILKMEDDAATRVRRDAVKAAMQHAWKGYSDHAFGADEVQPSSGSAINNWGGMGNTLVDSLDTLWIMGMKDEFWKCRDWVRDKLAYNISKPMSTFETTIRSLGGLLAAYDWSGDKVFLDKAIDLGDRLLYTFGEGGLPKGQSLLRKETASNAGWLNGQLVLAEIGTLQVEFRYLAAASGNKSYAERSEKVFHIMNEIKPKDGLYPTRVSVRNGKVKFSNSEISFGAMGDSFYEYMLKIWLQGGQKESMYRTMYDESMDGMVNQLIQKSTPGGLTYIAERNANRIIHKMDHLACFMGGLLALGAYTDPGGLESERAQRDLQLAKDITYTCYQMYKRMPSGIAPEAITFSAGRDFDASNARYYILRPETVESFFILNQLTGDPIYREWGWEIFQSIEKHCRTEIAYSGLRDVTQAKPTQDHKMESFFLAETLKYLYLLFDPDTPVDVLKKHVFNTEAHPLRRFDQLPDLKPKR
eukprot:CAMPEP_0194286482 /NCGR_PEP_ID=MMETSP0169-20130528/32653_1 /TAXON_ID=218684 /ORGANISM="Corethron pennatum, Strain L29A3" /LENGTH=577 /DNA_ID=CAMNT_0039032943 /DNA_START=313 /DNA_END=2046 /DNA_ORIENTATION=-